jgi:hypothetical protein
MISFVRTIVDLPAAHLRALDEICAREGISRAEAVRRAVARWVAEQAGADVDDAFGLWGDRVTDALVYEDELRGPRDADAVAPTRPARGSGGRRRR